MTGGHNNDTLQVEGSFNDNTKSYTTGGQIGAPSNRGCASGPLKGKCGNGPTPTCIGGPNAGMACNSNNDCPSSNFKDFPWGDWQHNHKSGPDDTGSITDGSFGFHSGTASAPPEAFIKSIICADPGWCQQARPAPVKQIFWEGTGVFHTLKNAAGKDSPLPIFASCGANQPVAWSNKPGTVHYYRAHVADFGEPAGTKQNPPGSACQPFGVCQMGSTGPHDDTCNLVGGLCTIPFTPNGGGTTSCVADSCTDCPDWYDIEIHCTADPASPIAYRVAHFITDGNFQLHPPVSQNCNGPITKLIDEQPSRGETSRESFVARVWSLLPTLDVR
jgi:hypothetical protein